MHEVPVLIAGGGPVGLTLAHELAAHGIGVLVVERNATTTRHPKMDLTNSRSLELYGRLGLSPLIRRIGVPVEHNFDVAWVTSPTGRELHRFRYPSQTEMWARIRATDDGTMPAEPAVRISQIVLEPALCDALILRAGVEVRFGCAFESFDVVDQPGGGGAVLVRLRDADGGAETVRARFLVGCDGGSSLVRRQLGIELDGTPGMRASYTVHFRSRAHDVLQRWGVTWHTQGAMGTLVAQDDDQYWTLHSRVPDGVDGSSLDPAVVLRDFLGVDIEPEILVANPWQAHLLVADRYRHGPVFLCGDATHQFVPTGGYGMNTGVGDAVDLGWKLAAVLNGWGGPALLDSYEAERRPVALRNREASRAHVLVRFRIAELYAAQGDAIHRDDEAGERARAALAAQIAEVGNAENECWGIEHGYVYADSPVLPDIAGDNPYPAVEPGDETETDRRCYLPTTVPGARLPSVWLSEDVSLYELLGVDLTLLVVGADTDVGDVEDAAELASVPLQLVRIDERWRAVFERNLVLVRPDHHVAWRGDEVPGSWSTVLALVCGWGGGRPE